MKIVVWCLGEVAGGKVWGEHDSFGPTQSWKSCCRSLARSLAALLLYIDRCLYPLKRKEDLGMVSGGESPSWLVPPLLDRGRLGHRLVKGDLGSVCV